jgi:hypothetical protein
MSRFTIAISFLAAVVLLSVPVSAHHSFGAEYDANKPITLTGVITKTEWTNPHSHFYIDVKDEKANVANWKFEGYNPAVLMRVGWKKDSMLKIGDKITVFGWQARDGRALGARARDHSAGRQEAVLRAAGRDGRWRQYACRGGEVMRGLILLSILAVASPQNAPRRSPVPKAFDGKPDLTGVWQGGSTQRGSWEKPTAEPASAAAAPILLPRSPVPRMTGLPAAREPPYQPWAAQKVLEAFNRRGIDDPTARCLPAGITANGDAWTIPATDRSKRRSRS